MNGKFVKNLHNVITPSIPSSTSMYNLVPVGSRARYSYGFFVTTGYITRNFAKMRQGRFEVYELCVINLIWYARTKLVKQLVPKLRPDARNCMTGGRFIFIAGQDEQSNSLPLYLLLLFIVTKQERGIWYFGLPSSMQDKLQLKYWGWLLMWTLTPSFCSDKIRTL